MAQSSGVTQRHFLTPDVIVYQDGSIFWSYAATLPNTRHNSLPRWLNLLELPATFLLSI
jgi:hypothetical protein